MELFTGIEYIKIAVANAYGLDKKIWAERISWFNTIDWTIPAVLEEEIRSAKEPLLMKKALNAYADAMQGTPTGFIMGLDASASGLQIMACLIGCKITAKGCNVISTGKRSDIYQNIITAMDSDVPREDAKQAIMTTMYGSVAEPERLFGENTDELAEYYSALEDQCPGAMEVLGDVQSCWQADALSHNWILPDGHHIDIKVMQAIDKKIEVDELDHATFTHRANINQGMVKGISLIANVVHSVDAYVVREMYRRAFAQGFDLLTIHDSFWASPNHMNKVRQNYVNILSDIAKSDLLQDILRSITGDSQLEYHKYGDISNEVLNAEYAIS